MSGCIIQTYFLPIYVRTYLQKRGIRYVTFSKAERRYTKRIEGKSRSIVSVKCRGELVWSLQT